MRPNREMTNATLARLSGDFAALYSGPGRLSIAPEMLLMDRSVPARVDGSEFSQVASGSECRY